MGNMHAAAKRHDAPDGSKQRRNQTTVQTRHCLWYNQRTFMLANNQNLKKMGRQKVLQIFKKHKYMRNSNPWGIWERWHLIENLAIGWVFHMCKWGQIKALTEEASANANVFRRRLSVLQNLLRENFKCLSLKTINKWGDVYGNQMDLII